MSHKKNDATAIAPRHDTATTVGKAGGMEPTKSGWDSIRLGGTNSGVGASSVHRTATNSITSTTTAKQHGTIVNPYSSKGEAAAINVHESTEHMTLTDLLAKDLQILADKAMKEMLMGDGDDEGFDNNDENNRGMVLSGGKRSRPGSQYDTRLLDKATILQEAKRLFSDSFLVRDHPLHCATALVQLYQLEEGSTKDNHQKLTQIEAIDIFFGVSKLFLSPHPSLRRLVYLFLKVLLNTQLIPSSDVIIVQSCLTKDMVCPLALYKANSLRVLVQMMNPPMLSSVERYIKSMLVDFSTKCDALRSSSSSTSLSGSSSSSSSSTTSLAESARVSSAALVSAVHLSLNDEKRENPNSATKKSDNRKNSTFTTHNNECAMIIQRWVAEVHDAMVQPAMLSSSNNTAISMQQKKLGGMVQFHAIMLLFVIKNHDRRSIQRLIMEWSMSKKTNTKTATTNDTSNTFQGMFGRMRDTIGGGSDSNNNRRDKRSKSGNSSSNGNIQLISPLSAVLGIRIISKYIRDEYKDGRTKELELSVNNSNIDDIQSCYHKIYTCLTHFSAMVAYEAARSICTLLPESSPNDIATAIDVLHSLMKANTAKKNNGGGKPCIRLAAIRTLYQVSQTHPSLVSRTNDDLKYLIADPNRMVGTLAITTLLQTAASSAAGGSNTSSSSSSMFLDTCLGQICKFVHIVVEDDYRVHIVESLKKLCFIHPKKHRDIVNILGTFLRDEGGYKFKKRVVQIMVSIMNQLTRTGEEPDDGSNGNVTTINNINCNVDISPFSIEVKDRTLSWLCEYVEDCEFVNLSTYVLHLIGVYGTEHVTMRLSSIRKDNDDETMEHYLHEQTKNSSKYIRFVYNRYMLERAPVRASAITTLQRFGICIPSLRRSIWILLKRRAIYDNHDEVRDRATLAVSTLGSLLLEGDDANNKNDTASESVEEDHDRGNKIELEMTSKSFLVDPLPISFDQLEQCLCEYKSDALYSSSDNNNISYNGTEENETISRHPIISFETLGKYVTKGTTAKSGNLASGFQGSDNKSQYMNGSMIARNDSNVTNGGDNNIFPTKLDPAAALYDIPELAALGPIWKSCTPAVELTERETEYVVSCMKHIFMDQQHVVLQFIVENTIENQCLKNVTAAIELLDDNDDYDVVGEVPALSVPYGRRENCFTLLKRREVSAGVFIPPSMIEMHCELHFSIVSVDPMTGEEEEGENEDNEEYPLDGMTIKLCDFILTKKLKQSHSQNQLSFKQEWEQLGRDNEVIEKFALKQHYSIKDALKAIVQHMGLKPCDGTDIIKEGTTNATKSHIVHLRGTLLGAAGNHVNDATTGATTSNSISHHHPILARAQLSVAQQKSDGLETIILKIVVRSNNIKISQAIADNVA